jgi:hypothetical protein
MPFFDGSHSAIRVSTNGFISFDTNLVNPGVTNLALPQSDNPNGVVAPFWDDFVVDAAASLSTSDTTLGGERVFVVEWNNVLFYNSTRRVRFSALLFAYGRIVFNYADLDAVPGGVVERGAAATVGIENQSGTAAVQRSFNQPLLIEFVRSK